MKVIISSLLTTVTMFASISFATAPSIIQCSGYDMYGDVKWNEDVFVYPTYAVLNYWEAGTNTDYQRLETVLIQNGKIQISAPGGLVDAYLNVTQVPAKLELYIDGELRSGPGPYDEFNCK